MCTDRTPVYIEYDEVSRNQARNSPGPLEFVVDDDEEGSR